MKSSVPKFEVTVTIRADNVNDARSKLILLLEAELRKLKDERRRAVRRSSKDRIKAERRGKDRRASGHRRQR